MNDLLKLVAEMRAAQRKYFRTRAQGDLNESKRLERAVDAAVEEASRPATLFDRMEAEAEEAGVA